MVSGQWKKENKVSANQAVNPMENCEKIDPKSSSVLAGSDEVPDELVREEEGNLLSNLSIECEGGR